MNLEIRKLHTLGRSKLPLQPPGSLDGNQMFGFSSPIIIQVSLLMKPFLPVKHYIEVQIGIFKMGLRILVETFTLNQAVCLQLVSSRHNLLVNLNCSFRFSYLH